MLTSLVPVCPPSAEGKGETISAVSGWRNQGRSLPRTGEKPRQRLKPAQQGRLEQDNFRCRGDWRRHDLSSRSRAPCCCLYQWKLLTREARVVISNQSQNFGCCCTDTKGPTKTKQRHCSSQRPADHTDWPRPRASTATASVSWPEEGKEGEDRPIPCAMTRDLSAAAACSVLETLLMPS